jgi:hypothetical protein
VIEKALLRAEFLKLVRTATSIDFLCIAQLGLPIYIPMCNKMKYNCNFLYLYLYTTSVQPQEVAEMEGKFQNSMTGLVLTNFTPGTFTSIG